MYSRILFSTYTAFLRLANVYIAIFSIFNKKLELLFNGRGKTWETLELFSKKQLPKPIWIHCASLGEFEQGRPLIEKIKLHYPNVPIVLSFFSSSGYEIMKHYDTVDAVFYLPADLPANNKRLLDLIHPRAMIFVKYEFWWNLILELQHQKISTFVISSVFRKEDYFFASTLSPFSKLLKGMKHIFVQDEQSAHVLSSHEITNYSVVGDTRIDRVIQRSKTADVGDALKEYCSNKTVIMYGSVWKSDMKVVNGSVSAFPDFIHVLVPHDVKASNVSAIQSMLSSSSDIYSNTEWSCSVMIIDNIGMLSSLYRMAKYAYVGGGFQHGIHNILEPAVYKIPVFFGPKYKKFNEANYFVQEETAFCVQSGEVINTRLFFLEQNPTAYITIEAKLERYFSDNKGVTDKILHELQPILSKEY